MISENFNYFKDLGQTEAPAEAILSPGVVAAVEQRLMSEYDFQGNGTMGLAKKLAEILEQMGSSVSPVEAVSVLAHSEEMMEKMEVMWDEIRSGNRENYPFVLAILHSQLPLSDMSIRLAEIVRGFPRVPYSIETFSPSFLCSQAEGFLSTAIKTDQVGSDGRSFLVKTSRGIKSEQVGLTAGVTSHPALACDVQGEKVIVPYVWYRPESYEVKESIGAQIYQTTGTFLVPGSTWQIVRQFEELDFSQMYGRSLKSAQQTVSRRLGPVLRNDEQGVSHI